MTEYRALTQGGCVAGSQTFNFSREEASSTTFTTPACCTKIYAVCSGNYNKYISVSPNTTYTLGNTYGTSGQTETPYYGYYFGSTKIGTDRNSSNPHITVSWSNDINNHA